MEEIAVGEELILSCQILGDMVGVASMEGPGWKGRERVKARTKELRGREIEVMGPVVTVEARREGFISYVVQGGEKRLAYEGKVNAVLTTSVGGKMGLGWMLVGEWIDEVVVGTKLLEG